LTVFLSLLIQPNPSLGAGITPNASFWQSYHDAGELSLRQHEQVQLIARLAELYAAEHDGEFPANVSELMQMWPGGLLVNLATLARTEPVDGVAMAAGQIGYAPVVEGSGTVIAGWISAFGKSAETWTYVVGHVTEKR